MKDGTARQVASPAEVYANPADLDVARFMGYRNELALGVTRRDGDRVVVTGGGLTLTGSAKGELAPGTRVRAAVRPDDIVVADAGAAVPNAIDGVVDAIEYGGRESLIDVMTQGGVRLHVRSAAAVRIGAPVRIGIPEARLLVYREGGA
jgi:putative spermidine/putrescine transport system ATP-binding protein